MRRAIALPIANLVACLLFVLLRDPDPWYLAEVDRERQRGGMLLDDGVWGTLACRTLYGWSTFHGGEQVGVAALEVLNLPSLVVTGVVGFISEVTGLAARTSVCRWSWLLAGLFIVLASAQWWIVGWTIDRGRHLVTVHPALLAYALAPLGAMPTSGLLLLYYAITEDDLVHGTTFMTFAVHVAYWFGLLLLPVWWVFEKAGWRGWRYYVPTGTCAGLSILLIGGADDAWEWYLMFAGSGMSCAIVFSLVLKHRDRVASTLRIRLRERGRGTCVTP